MKKENEMRKLQDELDAREVPYVIATVVNVRGSASAKPGSKMLVSGKGENLWGWIGGGCAESFTRENALEALSEKQTRIITADLDDEVFGLGMPCGGVMDIFLEPVFPREKLVFALSFDERLAGLCEHFGFEVEFSGASALATAPIADLIISIASQIVKVRNLPSFSAKDCKVRQKEYSNELELAPSEFLILGTGRITEELAKLGALLEWNCRVYGINPTAANYPSSVKVEKCKANYEGLDIRPGSVVVVASHHRGDAEYIAAALGAKAQYVGFVASSKRAGIVFDHLREKGLEEKEIQKVFSPAGVHLNCQNPSEIALSILSEILLLSGNYLD